MAMAANEIEALIKAAIPDARVTVEDLAGDGDHYAATVVSRKLPRHHRASSSIRSSMPRCAAEWGASCTPSRCKPQPPTESTQEFRQWPTKYSSASRAKSARTPVMLYMKGTAMFPQCGFSARVVQILTHMGVPFKTANVLEDAELREGIKQFSQWPTIPQLYVKGEFVGGCDIITEMFQSGELETLLAEKGVEHKTEA